MISIRKTLAILALAVAALPARAENLALVLSFENYENGRDVGGVLSEHDALLAAYRNAGYETFGGRDRTHAELRRLLRNFVQELPRADNAVIHIAGHIVTFGTESWILPSDTADDSLVALEVDGLSIDFLLQVLATKPGQSALFLGLANRDFDNISGVRRAVTTTEMPDGVMMISGPHDDVSRAFLRDFMRPNTTVVEALAENRGRLSIDGDIPFGMVLAGNRPAPQPEPEPRVDTPEDIEKALRLSRNQRRAIQADLTILGHSLGTVDGIFGNATRRAIQNWQRQQGFTRTGFLARAQIQRLDRLADAARAEQEGDDRAFWARTGAAGTATGLRAYLNRYPNGIFATRAQNELSVMEHDVDVAEWDRAVDQNTLESYQRYLSRFPEGVYNRLAKVRIQEFLADRPDPDEAARRAEERLRLDTPTRMLIEIRLAGLGYRVGTPDGNFDDATRRAIRGYQDDKNLPETGYVSADMIRLLLLGR